MTITVNQIKIGGVVTNTSLPIIQTANSAIADDARVEGFFTPKPSLVTNEGGGSLDGLISAMSNRKTGSALELTEAVTTAQPQINLDGGPTTSRPALQFFTSGDDKLTANAAVDVSGDFFRVAIFKSGATTSNEYLLYTGTSGNRWMFHLGTGNKVYMRVGASGTEANVSVAFIPDEWNLAIGTWNAATETAGISINGGAFVYDTQVGAVVDETGVIVSGGKLDQTLIHDFAYGTGDLSTVGNADLLAYILTYARAVGVTNVS